MVVRTSFRVSFSQAEQHVGVVVVVFVHVVVVGIPVVDPRNLPLKFGLKSGYS